PSRVSHRDSPIRSRRATPAPLTLPHLSLLSDFLNQAVLFTGLSSRMVSSPSYYSFSEFSEGEAFIIPLLCWTLEAIGSTNERLDLLTATVENLEITTSPQPATLPLHPLNDFDPFAALYISICALSTRYNDELHCIYYISF